MKETLLRMFKESGGNFLSGEELSRKLNCTRAAVWKHIEELRKEGYEFEAVRKAGYRLIHVPDLLTPEEIGYPLHTEFIGQSIRYFHQVESTQLIAHQWAEEGAPEGALVVAEHQSSGRGRMGRRWYSPAESGIWMSMILRPQIELRKAPQLTLLTAVAVTRAMKQMHPGLDIRIKWPNDILIGSKKVCGILTELNAESDRIHYLVIGMGINVNAETDSFPEEVRQIATSLRAETGTHSNRAELVRFICEQLEQLYQLFLEEGFHPIKLLWESYAVFIGEKRRISTMEGVFEGIIKGIDEEGVLLLELNNGIIKKILSADLPLE